MSDFYCDLDGNQHLTIWNCATNNWGRSSLAPDFLTPQQAKEYCKDCMWGASYYCAAFPYSPYDISIAEFGQDWLNAIHRKDHLDSTHWIESSHKSVDYTKTIKIRLYGELAEVAEASQRLHLIYDVIEQSEDCHDKAPSNRVERNFIVRLKTSLSGSFQPKAIDDTQPNKWDVVLGNQ